MISQPQSTRKPSRLGRWPDYRTIWRWHFYAGLFCIPFVCWLSVTGAIYLFTPQIDALIDRPYDRLAAAPADKPSQDVTAAMAAMPGWVLHDYILPRTPRSAARVILGRDGKEMRVYVDRTTHAVLKTVPEERRFTRLIFHMHGELLMGDRGSMIVELAACWAIVMILTGLYLWWPRNASGLGGVLYPRLGRGGRAFWRDLHGVAGVWVSGFALLMLVSGLPWAKNWGGYLKDLRRLAGAVELHQDWTTGPSSQLALNKAMDAAGMAAMPGMAGMPGMAAMPGMSGSPAKGTLSSRALAALDRVAPAAAALRLTPPVLISPPSQPGGTWKAASNALNRTQRAKAEIDPATGRVASYQSFAERPAVDRIVGIGISAHVGQLFGWPNQLLGVCIALCLLTVSVSALVLWWRRRARGVLGAPAPPESPRFSPGLVGLVVVLGALLPLFGLSLVGVALTERLLLRRLPSVRDWLGLRTA